MGKVMSYEEWAAQDSDPGTIDYLEYLGELITKNAAEIVEAKKIYLDICKRDGIDLDGTPAADW